MLSSNQVTLQDLIPVKKISEEQSDGTPSNVKDNKILAKLKPFLKKKKNSKISQARKKISLFEKKKSEVKQIISINS